MAGRGPAPKAELTRPNDQARRDAKSTALHVDGVVRGPDLPDGDWHPMTVAWWETWRRSAQAQLLIATDWDDLLVTALLHSALWSGDLSRAAEVRLRTARHGATVDDRRRLLWDVDAAETAAVVKAPVRPAARRRRLLKAVGDAS